MYVAACLREGIQPEPIDKAARQALEVILADGGIETPGLEGSNYWL